MKIFITGDSSGQLHWELVRTAPESVDLLQTTSFLDITNSEAVADFIAASHPDLIINVAAYTAVDKAESEPEIAQLINVEGVRNLAQAAASVNAQLTQISTDFIFGPGDGSPFKTSAAVGPVSVYGQTKLEGERLLQELLPENHLIVRSAWIYSANGNNFVKSMIRLMNERDEIGVIADQIGSPTWARSLAEMLWKTASLKSTGIMHWTGAGVASWYDFAQAIYEDASERGLIGSECVVIPLRTDQYPTPAVRPNYSVLELTSTWEALDTRAAHWRVDLRSMLDELLAQQR